MGERKETLRGRHMDCDYGRNFWVYSVKILCICLSWSGLQPTSGSCTRRKELHSQATKERLVLEAKDFIQHSMGKEKKKIVWERNHHATFLSPTVICEHQEVDLLRLMIYGCTCLISLQRWSLIVLFSSVSHYLNALFVPQINNIHMDAHLFGHDHHSSWKSHSLRYI